MLTPDETLSIIKSRKLQLIPVRDRTSNTIGWVCKTIDGMRAAPSNRSYPTPEEAVEAAELHLYASEEREKERNASSALSSLEKLLSTGRYVKPRHIQETGETHFDILTSDGKPTNVKDKPSLIDALVESEKEANKKV